MRIKLTGWLVETLGNLGFKDKHTIKADTRDIRHHKQNIYYIGDHAYYLSEKSVKRLHDTKQ